MSPALLLALALAQNPATLSGSPSKPKSYALSVLHESVPTDCSGSALTTDQGGAVTVTRATSAYCTRADGTLVLLGNNLPRVESGRLAVDGAATNLALYSQEFDRGTDNPGVPDAATPWARFRAGTPSLPAYPAVTANAATAPDGTQTAEQVDFPAVTTASHGASAYSIVEQQLTGVSTSAANAGGLYMRACTGTATVRLFFVASGPTYRNNTECNLTTTWSRCVAESTTVFVAGTWWLGFGIDKRAGSADVGAQCIYVWQGDANASASRMGPPILTTNATATRNAENISVAVTTAMATTTEGCAAATVTSGSFLAANARILGTSSGSESPLIVTGGGNGWAIWDGTSNLQQVTPITSGTYHLRSGWRFSDTSRVLQSDVGTVTSAAFDGTMGGSPFTTLYLGSLAGANALGGHISKIRLGPTRDGCQ